jgi:predicted enzyme related to lactoylglutathione lyase
VLGFRVDDIAAAAASVRTHGGPIDEPQQPYGLAAEGRDDQGMPFYLHELPAVSGVTAGAGDGFHNGDVEGDVSYLTMVVLSVEAAQRFYGGVLGWTFNVGTAGGVQVTGVAPQIGMTAKPAAGPVAPGVILALVTLPWVPD